MRLSQRSRAIAWSAVVAIQIVCAGFFFWDLFGSRIGIRTQPIDYVLREVIQITAFLGLVLGIALGTVLMVGTLRHARRVEAQLDTASAAFAEVVDRRFDAWGLSPAERDVAWFAVKGFTTAEIAELRNTSESTVKAQTKAIYRKSGASGRAQLLSLLVDDILARAPASATARAGG